jgi:diguanylate cyclase (GGDEF)-like protein
MRLKHFLSLLFTLLLGATVWSSYHAYHTNRSLILDYIADWSSSALLQTEPSLVEALKASRYPTIQKLLDKGAASRPFITAYSLSRDGQSHLLSSDRSRIGKPVEGGYTTVTGSLYESISRGKYRFQLPMQYYHEGTLHTAYLLMELDRQYIFDQLVTRSLKTALQSVTAVIVVFGLFLFLLYRFLIVPVQHITTFVKTRHNGVQDYFISEFGLLSQTIRESFMTLYRQKEQIQKALQYEQYLEAILQTVADINKLLVVSKSTEELLQKSCDRLALHGDYRLAWIGFVREERIDMVAHSEDSTGYLKGGLGISLDPDDPTVAGPTAQSVLTNRTVIIDDLSKDPRFHPWQERADFSRFFSIIALPLRSDSYSAPFGSLAIYTANPRGFDTGEVTMLEELAGDIGFAMDTFEKRSQLQYHLTTDPLTGLANRAMLLEALSRQKVPEVMLVDIDQFREINEVYGFEIGDQLIKTFAATLKQFVESYPGLSLYCLGIDHFALLFSPGHGINIHDFAGTLIRHMERQQYDCFGIAIMPQVTTGFARAEAQTVERAELALKHAKSVKHKLTVFDPSLLMVEKYQETIQWYNVVRQAIDEDRIVPFFQGIVDNRSGRITRYEALIRLILDNGSVVAPGQFLEIAKKTRLYPDLTKIVVRKALRAFRDETAELSINISLEDILNPSVVATLHEEITANAIAERVTFELLESEGIKDYERVSTFIKTFKALGCKIAIDDFGSGYSNFEHLLKLRIDYLKIDGSLIQNLVHDRNAQVLVKHIRSFAEDLNMKTVAEFVCSEAIAEAVREIGIDYSQGYHFHKPSPREQLPKA